MAIINVLVKTFTSYVLYRIYQERGGEYTAFGISGINNISGNIFHSLYLIKTFFYFILILNSFHIYLKLVLFLSIGTQPGQYENIDHRNEIETASPHETIDKVP